MTERGLKNYNKRSDYGELDNAVKIAKDDTVFHFQEKDRIYLVSVKCLIIKKTKIKISKRNFECETTYKEGDEKLHNSFFVSRINRMADMYDNETLEIKEIKKIKAIGLVQ